MCYDCCNSIEYVIFLLLSQIEHMVKGHAAYTQFEEQARQKWAEVFSEQKRFIELFPMW